MYGRTVGTLNVYLVTNMTASSASTTKLWTLKGTQGNRWLSAQFAVQSSTGYQVKVPVLNVPRITVFLDTCYCVFKGSPYNVYHMSKNSCLFTSCQHFRNKSTV